MYRDVSRAEIEALYGPADLRLTPRISLKWWYLYGDPAERLVGALRLHRSLKDRGPCAALIWFDLPAARLLAPDPTRQLHALIDLEPLSLAPGLRCRACGHHGYITHGIWVDANNGVLESLK